MAPYNADRPQVPRPRDQQTSSDSCLVSLIFALYPLPRNSDMHPRSLLAYSSLVLSSGLGVLGQREMAKCLPGWEWVCYSLFLLTFWPREGI